MGEAPARPSVTEIPLRLHGGEALLHGCTLPPKEDQRESTVGPGGSGHPRHAEALPLSRVWGCQAGWGKSAQFLHPLYRARATNPLQNLPPPSKDFFGLLTSAKPELR